MTGWFPDEGIIFGAGGSIAVTADLVVDICMDSEDVIQDSAVDRISCRDVQCDGGFRNAILEYWGCCEGSVRRCEVVRQGRRPGGRQSNGQDSNI